MALFPYLMFFFVIKPVLAVLGGIMKRLFIFSLLLLSSAAYAKNKISMVTYFPVPYVAYSQVNTTDQMDIGLTSACSMKLGCSEDSATLNATRVNLKGGK